MRSVRVLRTDSRYFLFNLFGLSSAFLLLFLGDLSRLCHLNFLLNKRLLCSGDSLNFFFSLLLLVEFLLYLLGLLFFGALGGGTSLLTFLA